MNIIKYMEHNGDDWAKENAGRSKAMEHRIYKVMKGAGVTNITMGVITMVVGIATGILLIITGAKLIAGKSKILL